MTYLPFPTSLKGVKVIIMVMLDFETPQLQYIYLQCYSLHIFTHNVRNGFTYKYENTPVHPIKAKHCHRRVVSNLKK